MKTLYTYSEAAEVLGLAGRSSVKRRLISLAERGKPLTVEAGELYEVGARLLITDKGLARLREFEPLPAGRPAGNASTLVHQLV